MYSQEDRERGLRALSELGSSTKAARATGISASTLLRWAAQEAEGGGGRAARKEPVYLPFERKMELVRRLEAGGRAADLAREAGVSAPAVSSWRRRLREGGGLALMTEDELAARAAAGAEAPAPAGGGGELEALREENRRLRLRAAALEQTVEILKKGPGVGPAALTSAERARVVDALRDEFGLAEALAEAGLARSTYYYQRARAAAGDALAWLRPLVRAAFEAGRGAYGAARVWAWIRERGLAVSEKVVRRVMREEGLAAAAPRRAARYSSYAGEEGLAAAPNLLLVDEGRGLHDFSAGAPFEKLATDITEFRLPDDARKVYLSPALDLHDLGVLALAAGTSPSKELAQRTVGKTAAALPPSSSPLLHGDRGWHYRTREWVAACEAAGITRSMSRKGHTGDNAACEGFFGRLKVEFFRGRDWSGWSAEEFIEALTEYVRWYDDERLKLFVDADGTRRYETINGRRARLGYELCSV